MSHSVKPRNHGRGPLTPQQRLALRTLGVGEANIRHGASGVDLFAYVEADHSTLRVQIAPDGGVVRRTVLDRGPRGWL
jgi:hypothetical protein